MRKTWLVGLAVALALGGLPKVAYAQVRSETAKSSEAVKAEAKDWDKLLERIRPVYLKRLQEELKLDQATLDKVSQSLDNYRGMRRDLYDERRSLVEQIEAALERNAPEAELEALLAEYDAFSERRYQLMSSTHAEMRELLGTRGYAQYVLFRQKFRREIYKTLQEIKSKKEG